MIHSLRHFRGRELRFLGLIALTLLLIGLHLAANLGLAGRTGSGWRTVDLPALQRRIETGELRDREARWYHEATPDEAAAVKGAP